MLSLIKLMGTHEIKILMFLTDNKYGKFGHDVKITAKTAYFPI